MQSTKEQEEKCEKTNLYMNNNSIKEAAETFYAFESTLYTFACVEESTNSIEALYKISYNLKINWYFIKLIYFNGQHTFKI